MALDPTLVRAQYAAMVPMVSTLGIEFEALDEQHCTMLLPDEAAYRNHVGGPHAGAMWTLAESASGALVFSTGTGEDRLVTGSMTVTWTLKLNRR